MLVAFSGEVEDPSDGFKFTEPGMNAGIKERELPERFASDDFNILLVANKYQTGFAQPLLQTMYVDKAALRRAGRTDALPPQPDGAGQGGHLHPRLRERRGGDPPVVPALLPADHRHRDRRPAAPLRAPARPRRSQGLHAVRGQGLLQGLLQAPGEADDRRPCRDVPPPGARDSARTTRRTSASRSRRSSTSTRSSRRSSRSPTPTWSGSTPSASRWRRPLGWVSSWRSRSR